MSVNGHMVRYVITGILVLLLPAYSTDTHAQLSQASNPAAADVKADVDDTTGIDLFDGDAERTDLGWSQFYVAAGITYLDGDGKFSAQLDDGRQVTIIDFDRAGLQDTDSSYWLTLNWRSATSRWGAWFGSWRYDVTGSRSWQDSLPIDGSEIPVGAEVTTDFDARWYIFEVTYSVFRSESIDAGVGFGFHTVDLSTTLTTELELGDDDAEIVSSSLNTLAPLPNALFYLHWKLDDHWSLVSRVGYFSLNYDKFSGRMANAHTMLNYSVSSRWSLVLGYQFINLDLDVVKTDYTQVYDLQFSGPIAFARFAF